jgi:hypothetical protein
MKHRLGIFKIQTAPFLCDFIQKFKFKNNDKNLLLIRKLYATLNQNDAFEKKAFQHIYNATCFYTNGEKVISYRIENGFHELGIHHHIHNFEHYFSKNLSTREVCDVNFSFKKYRFKESLEKEIYTILSVKEGKQKVLVSNSDVHYIQAFKEQNIGIYLQMNTTKVIEYYTNDLIVISKRLEEKHTPIKLKSCFNCGYFKMMDDLPLVSNNSLHTCMLIKEKATDIEFNEAITHIWSYCSAYKPK